MASRTASGWRTTRTGASETVFNCESVTTIAISMMRSLSGSSPVISMSNQRRLFWSCAMPLFREPLCRMTLSHNLFRSMHWFTVAFLAAIALTTVVRLWLSRRHIRHVLANRNAVPAEFEGRIALAAHQKSADYTIAKARFGQLETLAAAAALLAFTLGGGLQFISEAWERVFEAGGYAHGIALIASVALISRVIDLPFALYRTFVIEARFGFNRTSLTLFVADLAKLTALSVLVGIPLVFLVLWLMAKMGETWWLYVWLTWVAFNLLIAMIYPTLIAPLFNKFSPLEDAALRSRIESWQRLFHRFRRGQTHRALRHADFAPRPARDRGGARPRTGAFLTPSRVEAHGTAVRRESCVLVGAGVVDRTGVVLHRAGRAYAGDSHGSRALLHGRAGVHVSVAPTRVPLFAPPRI